jgi:TPP-dependent pyruvate/acetoin dehydrogenase alpha subunit
MQKISKEILSQLFTAMQTIRTVEDKVAFVYPEQEIKCPVHLCTGQEAIAAGVCIHLKKEDTIFSTHRSHGHCIAKGMDLKPLIAELYGRTTGCARGKGGSMHLVSPEDGIPGTTAIVGGCIPLAVGAALSSVMQKKNAVSVAFFGDGAVDEGTFHESMNFASLRKLPVVFVCENNNYATNSPRKARQPDVNIAARAAGYGIPGASADGNDVLAVYREAEKAVKRARAGEGPTLLEFITYRWKGHVGPTADIESGCRPSDKHEEWLKKCPLDRFKKYLLDNKFLSSMEMSRANADIEKTLMEAMEFAKSSPLPQASELYDQVW